VLSRSGTQHWAARARDDTISDQAAAFGPAGGPASLCAAGLAGLDLLHKGAAAAAAGAAAAGAASPCSSDNSQRSSTCNQRVNKRKVKPSRAPMQ
jgi:hypothetical protein